MEAFHWNKNFITGLTEVDQQHHQLVNILNRFGSLLAEDKVVFDDIEEVFTELASYAQYHFKEEEALMFQIEIDSRHLKEHLESHQDFLKEVTFMHATVSPDSPEAAKNLLDFLTHWLAFHILGSDQNMARQIEAIKAGSTPAEAYDKEERERDNSTEPLINALKGLFQQVSARNRDLSELNQSLEAKVSERTKELLEANLHLEELSLTDALTGLPNRRHGMRQLERLWSESLKSKSPLSCMMIDADHFKEVNDTYGHDAGDVVLCELAKTLQDAIRTDDIVCRLGGDEFFIVCSHTGQEGAMIVAEVVRKKVSELCVPTGDGAWHGSVSIGVASSSIDMKDYEALIKAADTGVYNAKRDGKNCVRTANTVG